MIFRSGQAVCFMISFQRNLSGVSSTSSPLSSSRQDESPGPVGERLDQPYVLHHSFASSSTSIPRKTIGGLVFGAQLARSALPFIQRRGWGELRYRLTALRDASRAEEALAARHSTPSVAETLPTMKDSDKPLNRT